jgi:CheY-like chemotaxis protein
MKRILVIDENMQMREMQRKVLERAMYQVEDATYSKPFELSELIETAKKLLDS